MAIWARALALANIEDGTDKGLKTFLRCHHLTSKGQVIGNSVEMNTWI